MLKRNMLRIRSADRDYPLIYGDKRRIRAARIVYRKNMRQGATIVISSQDQTWYMIPMTMHQQRKAAAAIFWTE